MKVVYVAGKYSGPTHDGTSFSIINYNIMVAREWAIKLMRLGRIVTLVPHLNSYHMELDFKSEQQFWYDADLELLRRCDAVFFLPDWEQSKGAKIEKQYADDHNIPTFFNLEDIDEWVRLSAQPKVPAPDLGS